MLMPPLVTFAPRTFSSTCKYCIECLEAGSAEYGKLRVALFRDGVKVFQPWTTLIIISHHPWVGLSAYGSPATTSWYVNINWIQQSFTTGWCSETKTIRIRGEQSLGKQPYWDIQYRITQGVRIYYVVIKEIWSSEADKVLSALFGAWSFLIGWERIIIMHSP